MNPGNIGRSENLLKLAQRLRLYNPDQNPDTSDGAISIKDSKFQASAAESAPNQEKSKPSKAAVLICLFEDDNGDLRVILTRRSSTMSSHSGEVALPGGKRDEGDADDVQTALREAEEEIGLDPKIVEVVAVLESFHTKRGIVVFPVVGIIWDIRAFTPVLNAAEVESIFDAPLEMFLKDENRREEERELMGCKYLLQFFEHQTEGESYLIWALTAGILIKAASVVYQREPDFEERRPQFWSRRNH